MLLLFGLWLNRRQPGLLLCFVGILSNAAAIAINGGHMPIWERALTAAGFTLADVPSTFHVVLRATLDAGFLLHAGPIHDIGSISLIVTIVGVVGALALWRIALKVGADFLFERPPAFWIAPKKAASVLQPAE